MILGVFHHKAVDGLRLIVFVELVELDDLYQLVGILRISGIAGSLQTARPALVIGGLQAEQAAIALTLDQEAGVILVRVES